MNDTLGAIWRVLRAGKPRASWALVDVATLATGSAIGALPPIFTGRIVDALQHTDVGATFSQLALYAAVTIVSAAIALLNTYATSAFREDVARTLRVELVRKLLHAKLSAIERLSFGEVANRLNEDVDGLCYKFEYALFPSISSAVALLATVVTMFALDVRFAAISCVAVMISVLPAKLVARRFTQLTRAEAANHDLRTSAVGESVTLGALALLRHPHAAARQLHHYAGLADATRRVRLGSAALSGVSGLSTTLVNLLGPIAVIALGAFLLMHHASTVGTIVMFLMYQNRLYSPFAALANLPLQTIGCGIIAKRVLEIYDLDEETSGKAPFTDGDVRIEGVTIEKPGRTIVRGARADIPAGSHVALVGPSGAGKSSIGSLLLRLQDPNAGCVRIGRRDVTQFELGALRRAVVIVPQDPLVFDTTLLENLTFLNPTAPRDEIERAIAVARLGDVVARLPEGYEAWLGQRGFRLSGGERQRVCVARALIAKPRILVLDEALTGVDVETEARIFEDLRAAYRDRTLIVVTHRLHCVAEFDRIVVVEDGAVTACGPHERALLASPWYRDAYAMVRPPAELLPA